MSDTEDNQQELQHLGKQKKKITQKQLEAGLNNLKKGPKQLSQNSIEKVENENSPYNFNNYYSSIEKHLNQLQEKQNDEIKEKKNKTVNVNVNKKLMDKIVVLEDQIKSTNNIMSELLNYKKQKMEKKKEIVVNKEEIKKDKIENKKISNIEKFILLQKSIKKI